MPQIFSPHPENPQVRLLRQAASMLDNGGVGAVPTDSCYALVCHLDDKAAVDRLRRIRGIDDRHHLTLLCRDLSELANFAKVDNRTYRLLKNATPGAYTFILEATREVPRRLSHPARKTIGLRVPEHPVIAGLLDVLGQPLLGTTHHGGDLIQHGKNLFHAALIEHRYLNAGPNQGCGNVRLQVGKTKHRVRLQRQDLVQLGRQEGAHLGFFLPGTSWPHGIATDADNARFLTKQIQPLRGFFSQTNDTLWAI